MVICGDFGWIRREFLQMGAHYAWTSPRVSPRFPREFCCSLPPDRYWAHGQVPASATRREPNRGPTQLPQEGSITWVLFMNRSI